MTKWDRFRSSLDRLHTDFEFPTATFENSTGGSYDPNTGEISQSYSSIGSLDVEFVPPSADSTIDTEGTHLDFDTSIRVPADDISELSASLVPYGQDSDYPTRVTVEGTTYELQSNVPEHGSGMRLLRLTEI